MPAIHPLLQATPGCPEFPSDIEGALPRGHHVRHRHRAPHGHHQQHRDEQRDEAACAVDAMLAVHQHALSLCQACDAQLEQVLRSLYPALLHLDGQDVPVAMSEAVDHQLDPLFLHEVLEPREDP